MEHAQPLARRLPFRDFGPILAVHFLGTLGFSLAIPFLVFIVTDLGGASWTYGLVGATYSAFQFLGAPILGRWSDRSGRRPVLVAGYTKPSRVYSDDVFVSAARASVSFLPASSSVLVAVVTAFLVVASSGFAAASALVRACSA